MTIEGRPEIVGSEQYWKDEYSRQRKDRMQDAIDDYLQDDNISPQQMYNEIIHCVDDVINYHDKYLDRASQLKLFLKGKLQ